MTRNCPETRAAGRAAQLAAGIMSARKKGEGQARGNYRTPEKAEALARLHTARASVNRRGTGDRGRDHGGE